MERKIKVGITEQGDASVDYSWKEGLSNVDGAVLITKNVTNRFIQEVLPYKNRVIVHATITGYGDTVIEPNSPTVADSFSQVCALVDKGFPAEKIVIRVDPIIPTPKGILTAYNVIAQFMEVGFSRFKVSILDMYPHVRERFKSKNLPLPYGDNFSPSKKQIVEVNKLIKMLKGYWIALGNKFGDLRIESCAEGSLTESIITGCISSYDLKLLGLPDENDSVGYQRKGCLCFSGKTELLNGKRRCPYKCLYCYWRD